MRRTTRLMSSAREVSKAFAPNTDVMLPSGTFAGETVLVTGGGSGLGLSMAKRFARLGAHVAVAGRREHVVEKAAKEIREEATSNGVTGGEMLGVSLDVRDADAVDAVLDKVKSATGSIPTVIVNNAAGNFISPTERLSANAFSSVFDIVAKGTANVTLAAGKRLIAEKRSGVFLAISTVYADTGSGFVVPSAAAKAAVTNMTKSLAFEWGIRHGLRFVGIAPGPIPTEGAFSRLDPSGMFEEAMVERTPASRLGLPEELANLATFLCSPYASWINGDTITIDGGERVALAGEMNELRRVTDEQWDQLEAMIRATNKKSKQK